jgi:hypothetical protein
MIKGSSLAALLLGTMLAAPLGPAVADNSQPATGDDGTGAQAAGPDDPLDDIATPNPTTDGSSVIEVPPIDIPEGDLGDYSPPESEDDGANDVPPSPDGSQN